MERTPKQHAEDHAKACCAAIAAGKPRPAYKGPSLDRANLDGANLYGANLDGASLVRASLYGASLYGASLVRADLYGVNLYGANLYGANLDGANLDGANLDGAIMPDGRTFEAYKLDPLAGICGEPEARERAIAAWGNHSWDDCPMHEAYGWSGVDDAPEDKRLLVAAFVALFDSKLLPKPEQGKEVI